MFMPSGVVAAAGFFDGVYVMTAALQSGTTNGYNRGNGTGVLVPADAPVLDTGAIILVLLTVNSPRTLTLTLEGNVPNTDASFRVMSILGATGMTGDYLRSTASFSVPLNSQWIWTDEAATFFAGTDYPFEFSL